MKILLQDSQTGLYMGRRREWTHDPKTARAFSNRFHANAYKVLHHVPRACAVAMPASVDESSSSPLPQDPIRWVVGNRTVVQAKLELGPGNGLFIRGEGEGLNWHQGQPLIRLDSSTWRWCSLRSESPITFQLLLNDLVWAKGADILLEPGAKVELVPDFEWPEIPRVSSDPRNAPPSSTLR
jgi:hypothetical protein